MSVKEPSFLPCGKLEYPCAAISTLAEERTTVVQPQLFVLLQRDSACVLIFVYRRDGR